MRPFARPAWRLPRRPFSWHGGEACSWSFWLSSLAFFFSDAMIRFGKALGGRICAPRLSLFAAAVGFLALALSFGVGEFLYQGLYTNMDEIASAIQARYLASGRIAGPDLAFPEAWLVTNTLMVDEGWVSQYPPSHLAIMAIFFRLGIPRLTGPVLMGLMTWLLALSFPRLLPKHQGTARAAVLLTALSPFLLFLGGGSLSHLTAGAARGRSALRFPPCTGRQGCLGFGGWMCRRRHGECQAPYRSGPGDSPSPHPMGPGALAGANQGGCCAGPVRRWLAAFPSRSYWASTT